VTGPEDELRDARQGKRAESGWSVDTAEEDDDALEWDDREEGILLSVSKKFLQIGAR
jgi:hypothetical protein